MTIGSTSMNALSCRERVIGRSRPVSLIDRGRYDDRIRTFADHIT